MRYIECPDVYNGTGKTLFLAGGITNCPIWQSDLTRLIRGTDLTVLNPRRKHFPEDNPNIEEEQIKWEYDHLRKATAVSFWFPKETLCPITLYELGKQSALNKPLFVGIQSGYAKQKDIEIQIRFARPEVKIVYSLKDLANQIKMWSVSSKL